MRREAARGSETSGVESKRMKASETSGIETEQRCAVELGTSEASNRPKGILAAARKSSTSASSRECALLALVCTPVA